MARVLPDLLEIYPRPAGVSTAGAPSACCEGAAGSCAGASAGSRRKRLWELTPNAHCPVVGVCLPIAVLRKIVDKALGGAALAVDYELHCGAIAECRLRSPIAEQLNKELDRRYAIALRQSAQARTSETLAVWWQQTRNGPDLAGALWATLTHARCDDALQARVLGEVHMLQHQVGSAQRVERRLLDTLVEERAALRAELAALQERHQQQVVAHARDASELQEELARLRAQLAGSAAEVGALRLRLAAPQGEGGGALDDPARDRRHQQQGARIAALEDQLRMARLEQGRLRAELEAQPAGPARDDAGLAPVAAVDAPAEGTEAEAVAAAPLSDRSVLCVGGRPASVPLYRHIIERTGGRFLHHDGGEEQNLARLERSLVAADLVICQTGCISHDAYWRVKNHCKRTGTPCVFVENPGGASLKRALAQLQAPGGVQVNALPTA